MTADKMAKALNGKQYMNEMTQADELVARDNDLVVVFGYSDDCIEFRGAICDELGCFDGGDFWVDKSGAIEHNSRPGMKKISAVWCGDSGACWEYETDIPHETFNIYEGDELFCVGIVFSLEDLR